MSSILAPKDSEAASSADQKGQYTKALSILLAMTQRGELVWERLAVTGQELGVSYKVIEGYQAELDQNRLVFYKSAPSPSSLIDLIGAASFPMRLPTIKLSIWLFPGGSANSFPLVPSYLSDTADPWLEDLLGAIRHKSNKSRPFIEDLLDRYGQDEPNAGE